MTLKKFIINTAKSIKTAFLYEENPVNKALKKSIVKKPQNILQRLWQDLSKKLLNKKIAKKHKKKTAHIEKTKTHNQNNDLDNDISYIEKLVKNYEQFIQRDFFAIIQNANAALRDWRSTLVTMVLANQAIPLGDLGLLTNNLQEINEIYSQTSAMIDSFTQNCLEYQEIVKDSKRTISPQEKLNQVETQLSRIKHSLEKGRKMTDLQQNNDYKYLTKYLEEQSKSRSISM